MTFSTMLIISILAGISIGCYSGVKIFSAHHYNLCKSAKANRVAIATIIGLMAMVTVLYSILSFKAWLIGYDYGTIIGVGIIGLFVLGAFLKKCIDDDEEYDFRYDPHFRNSRY